MGGPPKQTIPLSVLVRNQRILGHEISPYPEVGRGREWELAGKGAERQLATGRQGDWTAESWRRDSKESWRGTTDRGSQHWTPETGGDKIGSSEEDRLKMSAFELLVEFSLVTHASDSPHMHVVLHNSPFALELTPSIVRVCSSVLFSPVPPIVFLCSTKKCALPPQPLVDHRPA